MPTQEDWLNELPDTVQKPITRVATVAIVRRGKAGAPQATDARQRLQQQLGKPCPCVVLLVVRIKTVIKHSLVIKRELLSI